MSLKYSFLKGLFRLAGAQKLMAKPYDELLRRFKTEQAKPQLPKRADPAFDETVRYYGEHPALYIRHKGGADSVCMYLVGGGLLKYPKPGQIKEVRSLAKTTGRDMVLPYYPLRPRYDLFDAMEMVYAVYKDLTKTYAPENIAILGGSSGGYMTLVLMSMLHERNEGVPLPGKIYVGSPGTTMLEDERAEAERLNKTDVIMSTAALDTIFVGMAGGKPLPEYMLYTQRGNYTGLKEAYLSYGGDEVFSAAAKSTAKRLEDCGVQVTLTVEKGLYHSYAAMPLVKEAEPGYRAMVRYLTV